MVDKQYRYELKYLISRTDGEILKKKLRLLMPLDPHSISQNYSYLIRSLYYDDIYNKAFYEKVDGIEYRKKFRIRAYNYDNQIIKLECKHKDDNYTYKRSANLTYQQYLDILNKKFDNLPDDVLINEFVNQIKYYSLQPSVIVEYIRTAFVYPTSEVRITFDENIRAAKSREDMFSRYIFTRSIMPKDQIVLEIKCNEYIPEHILKVLESIPKTRQAVSKFAYCKTVVE